MFINALLSRPTIPDMTGRVEHQSFTRLMQAAKAATAGKPGAVSSYSDLAGVMNVSPQRVQNWSTRGVSLEGAIDAEARWGCYANWILTGAGPMGAPSINMLTAEALEIAQQLDRLQADPSRRKWALRLCQLSFVQPPKTPEQTFEWVATLVRELQATQ